MSSPWLDQPTSTRAGEGLDTEALSSYLQAYLPEAGGDVEVLQFPQGYSNLTYLIRCGTADYVLRRPPLGVDSRGAHDMGREYQILSHLAPVYHKAPRPIHYCDDREVLGAPFYLMERVEGVILRPHLPRKMRPDAALMDRIADGVIATFSELHAVDFEAAGLAGLGRPDGYVKRQVEGWTRRYLKAKTDDVGSIEHLAYWLRENLPKEHATTLIHNDFKYDNVVLHRDDLGRVIAVLDWEMATLGDPLSDLGTTLGYWLDPDDPPEIQQMSLSPTTLPGNPTRAEVAERYARVSGRPVDHLVFYYVFGLFKIAVIVQQIYARYKKGLTQDERFATLLFAVHGLGLMAQQAITKQRIDRLFS